jgi:hypothetical protein
MVPEGDYPLVGASRDALGVVFGAPPSGDIEEIDGEVFPGTGGLSVVPTWRDLPPGRIPKRLRPLMPDARGSNRFVCWSLGDGEFVDEQLSEELMFKVDSPKHGLIGPSKEMRADQFQTALANTRLRWRRSEEDHG